MNVDPWRYNHVMNCDGYRTLDDVSRAAIRHALQITPKVRRLDSRKFPKLWGIDVSVWFNSA